MHFSVLQRLHAMAAYLYTQKILAGVTPKRLKGLLKSAFGSLILGSVGSSAVLQSAAIAQVNNADLACYLESANGQQYDLSALCGGFTAPVRPGGPSGLINQQATTLGTGDVQVTLRWEGAADLDLSVRSPAGDEVSFINNDEASGGKLDVDANSGCFSQMNSPVENVFWPAGEGIPGTYTASVGHFSHCDDNAAPDQSTPFTLDVSLYGEVQSYTGTLSLFGVEEFTFTLPEAPAENATASEQSVGEAAEEATAEKPAAQSAEQSAEKPVQVVPRIGNTPLPGAPGTPGI